MSGLTKFDALGREIAHFAPTTCVTHPSTGTTSFTYDNLGNVLTKNTGKGDVVTYSFVPIND